MESNREHQCWNRAMLLLLIVAGVLLICSYIGINLFRYTAGIDSDVAAEGLTARAMWVHGTIIPEAFYGSSETRIFNVNLLAAGLYGLLGDMNLSMGTACSVMMVVLIGLYARLLRRLRFCYVSAAAMVLFLLAAPVTLRHAQILYVQAVYYCIHCILMLITLMMWLDVMHEDSGSKRWIWRTAISSGLAFIISLSGLRAALICYAPLMLTEVLHTLAVMAADRHGLRPVRSGIYAFVTLLSAYAGTRMPTSVSMGTTRNIRHGLSKLLQNVIPDLLECVSLGEQDTVRNVLLILLLVIALGTAIWIMIATVQREVLVRGTCPRGGNSQNDSDIASDRAWILAFFILSLAATMLLCAFTTTESVWRYYFMCYYGISYGLGMFIEYGLTSGRWRILAGYGVVGMVFLYGMFVWGAELLPVLRTPVSNAEYDQIISWMQENDTYYGYSTYETSNAMTGYADGAVQISAVADLGQMDICKWLTDKTWYGPYIPVETNTAYVIPVSLLDEFAPILQAHEELQLVLETDHYKVYESPMNYSWQ